jgi:hypothetical protein
MFKEKVDLANQAMENSSLPRDYIWKNVFHISEDEFDELDDLIVEDQKRKFRYKQIAEEGNDPAETGQAFGTPHQIASLYGGKGDGPLDVPAGYNEKNPNEPLKIPGRPQKYKSTYGTDEAPFGRNGVYDMKSNAETKEDDYKVSFKGGTMNMEGTKAVYLQNKSALEKMFGKENARKTNLFEQSDLLSEDNIIEGLD